MMVKTARQHPWVIDADESNRRHAQRLPDLHKGIEDALGEFV